MEEKVKYTTTLSSLAEDIFLEIFCDVFGPEKTQYLSVQHPFADIYGNRRFIDFALKSDDIKIVIEIDGERYHNPDEVSKNKYYDDLLKQNVPERNKIIVGTYLNYVKDKKTVVFCASVKHAKEIADIFKEHGIKCEAVSGAMKTKERKQILNNYENGDINVLCACDLLNEGWDSPKTEIFLWQDQPCQKLFTYSS